MPTDESPERSPKKPSSLLGSAMGDAAPYLGLGIEIMLSMVFFVFLGYFADGWLGTTPWLLIVGAVLGMVATGVTLWKTVQDMDARSRSLRKRSAAERSETERAPDEPS